MKFFKNILVAGITLEILILLIAYYLSNDLPELYKYAARFSGRVSLLLFLIASWYFSIRSNKSEKDFINIRSLTAVFAILHYIHLFLLAMNVHLNSVSLVPHKLAGGVLAYVMILLYPIFFERIKQKKIIHTIYFLYIGFVMAMTYVARIKGEFEGASPGLFHKLALGLVVLSMLFFIYRKYMVTTSKT